MELRPDSRLKFMTLYQSKEGFVFWGHPEYPQVIPSDDDTEIDITTNRIDVISHSVYGTPYLWWFLALVNDIWLPPLGLHIGKKLYIPSAEVKDRFLG
jgi:hypothetical protein